MCAKYEPIKADDSLKNNSADLLVLGMGMDMQDFYIIGAKAQNT